MKKISGMTEEEVIALIQKIARQLSYKFVFGFYTRDDIEQQAFIFGLDGLERFDDERKLENFLRRHMKNRLINFKRDKYFRYEKPKKVEQFEMWEARNEVRKRLMSPGDIELVSENQLHDPRDFFDGMNYNELVSKINAKMPPELRNDFLRVCSGVKINAERHQQIKDLVRGLLDEAETDN